MSTWGGGDDDDDSESSEVPPRWRDFMGLVTTFRNSVDIDCDDDDEGLGCEKSGLEDFGNLRCRFEG